LFIEEKKMQDAKLTRRRFMLAGGAVAGVLAIPAGVQAAPAKKQVARLADIKVGEPTAFSYPGDEPAYVVDLGRAVAGGAGPKRSLVAYSALCQHMGCPVNYNARTGHFVCPCHASVFDPNKNGDVLEGPSTRGLPRIHLRVAGDAVYAVGVEQGLVYGRACNHS
jgi:arsenite oxidase small subunit